MSRSNRLAAIMFTDIQGYTKLMQEDEDKSIEMRKRHREVFQAATKRHDGEIIQYYGDGTLSIFESCVDAVRCGKELQVNYQSDPVIPVRVGIHLGDIVLSDEDIIGNSVNVASRVESLGVPGSVLISQKVYDEIRNKGEFEVKRLGSFHFKNDKYPRTIYAVEGQNLVIPKKSELQGKLETNKWWRSKSVLITASILFLLLFVVLDQIGLGPSLIGHRIESLAVLPLYDRIGLGPEDNYIIEGIHEEIITRLSKVGLNVKPYSTMIRYRTNSKQLEEIGKELDVDGLVEGSVFRNDDIYRIKVQIIEVTKLEYITDPYEAEAKFGNIMSVYSDLVETIADQIKYSLSEDAKSYLKTNVEVDPEAYDLFLRGRYYLNKGGPENIQLAIDYYNQSLEKDPDFVDAHISLVESYLLMGFSSTNPGQALDRFRYHLAEAIEKDPFFSKDHHLMAVVKVFDNWDWKGAAEELEKAIKAYPKTWEPYDSYCQLMWAMGKLEKSIEAGKKAVSLEPEAHYAQCDLAWAYYFDNKIDLAEAELDRTIEQFGTDCQDHMGLSIILDIDKKSASGQSLITTIDRIEREIDRDGNLPFFNLALLGYAHALEGNQSEALEIAYEMEANNKPGAEYIYIALGEDNKAFEILEEAISSRSFYQMYAIKSFPWYDPIRNDPRFERILTRMGLAEHQIN